MMNLSSILLLSHPQTESFLLTSVITNFSPDVIKYVNTLETVFLFKTVTDQSRKPAKLIYDN